MPSRRHGRSKRSRRRACSTRPSALARELLRNFPKSRRGRGSRRRRKGAAKAEGQAAPKPAVAAVGDAPDEVVAEVNGAADALAAARALEAVPAEGVLDEALAGGDGDQAVPREPLEDDDEIVVVESELEGYSVDE